MADVYSRYGGPDILVFAFSSGGEDFRHEVPAFEWMRTLERLPVTFMLFRDSTERWYQDGIRGIGERSMVVELMRSHARNHKRTIALGLSSGAYAALLFGQLVPVDEVIAISPLTVLGPDAEREFGPTWAHRVWLPPNFGIDIDLRPFYVEGPTPKVRAFVSDGEGTELDRKMAELIGIKDITLIPGCSHARLARRMVDTGIVQKLIMGEPL